MTKATYEKRLAQRKSGQNRRKASLENEPEQNCENEDVMDGRRIVELKVLGQQLWCVSCKEALSLEHIENETRRGLGSLLSVRCHKCLLLNQVATGKQHSSSDKRSFRFDVNSKAALGITSCYLEMYVQLCNFEVSFIASLEMFMFEKY